jgi:preprotein translocase subunit YajC
MGDNSPNLVTLLIMTGISWFRVQRQQLNQLKRISG